MIAMREVGHARIRITPSIRASEGNSAPGRAEVQATDKDDPTVDEAFGRVGNQVIENTSPLNIERGR
jgi:hypothetical protein